MCHRGSPLSVSMAEETLDKVFLTWASLRVATLRGAIEERTSETRSGLLTLELGESDDLNVQYISRTIPEIQDLLQPLETAIHQHFIQALTGREACSALERDLLALPTRLGGMGLANPTSNSAHAFQASLRITAPLVALIASQDFHQTVEKADQLNIKKQVKKTNRELQKNEQEIQLHS